MTAEQRAEIAKNYFRQGYNCCQSVVMAFKDVCGLEEDVLLKMTVGLGGGVGRMREVCGCVCGMAVLSGFFPGHPATSENQDTAFPGHPAATRNQPQDIRAQKAAAYTLTQKMAGEFRKETGGIVCRELLGIPQSESSPVPEQRTADYYRKRPCADLVALAARIVSEELEGRD